ncbi:MAG: histidine kinase [Taibaiella sp.]|jgi:ligand-binding sensor domain-containing protein
MLTKKISWITLSVAFLICLNVLCAHGQEISFIQYNTDNSPLPHDVCYELMQDRQGYLWAGTDNGLVRFDGRDMKIYRQEFQSPFAIAAAEYDSTFMISTWKGGVYKLAHDAVMLLKSPDSSNILSTNNILVYKDIVILYAFNVSAFYRYNRYNNTLRPIDLLVHYTDNREARIRKSPVFWQRISNHDYQYCILNDQLIAYNRVGIFRLRDTVFEQVSNKGFEYILQTNDKNIYGVDRNCVYRLSRDLNASRMHMLSKNMNPQNRIIHGFYPLASGNMVLQLSDAYGELSGSMRGKFLYINFNTGQVIDLAEALGVKVFIADILIDREHGFWVSTNGQGLFHVFEPRYQQYTGFENTSVTDMIQHGNKRLYVGTKKGLYLLSGQKAILIYPNSYVARFFKNKNNEICVQSKVDEYGGIKIGGSGTIRKIENDYYRSTPHYNIIEASTGTVVSDKHTGKRMEHVFDSMSSMLTDICEDGAGRIWQASSKGLYFWDNGGAHSWLYAHPVISSAIINKLLPDTKGGVWVASSAGLFYLRNNKVILEYNESNGLSNAHVNTILLHNDKLWIGTQNGLNILNLKSGNISMYKKYNGLISNDVTALTPFSDSGIAIGSSKGISIMNIREPDMHTQKTKLILEHVYANDKKVSAPVIAGYNSHITVTYNVVSFVYPELVRFQYRLTEKDQWIETKNKSIILTSLAAGKYQLQIRARKYNDSWSDPVVLPIQIKKPWWGTTLFYAIITCCIVLGIYFVFRSREIKTRKKAVLKQQFSELKLKALQARLNPHFISNAFSTIQFFNLTHNEETANDYLTRFANLTRLLLESSHNRFILLKDEIQIIAYYLSLEKLRFKDKFIYSISVSPDIDTEKELIPGVLLQPFVENSINHGIAYLPKGTQGHININIKQYDGQLKIEITDNGVGRQKAKIIQQKTGKVYKSRSSEIIDEINQAVNNLADCYIHTAITDIRNRDGTAAGTQVNITCSINSKYFKNYEDSNH